MKIADKSKMDAPLSQATETRQGQTNPAEVVKSLGKLVAADGRAATAGPGQTVASATVEAASQLTGSASSSREKNLASSLESAINRYGGYGGAPKQFAQTVVKMVAAHGFKPAPAPVRNVNSSPEVNLRTSLASAVSKFGCATNDASSFAATLCEMVAAHENSSAAPSAPRASGSSLASSQANLESSLKSAMVKQGAQGDVAGQFAASLYSMVLAREGAE